MKDVNERSTSVTIEAQSEGQLDENDASESRSWAWQMMPRRIVVGVYMTDSLEIKMERFGEDNITQGEKDILMEKT